MVSIIDAGSPRDQTSLALETRQGTHIQNERPLPRDPGSMRVAKEQILTHHPKVTARALDSTYSCVSMVLASRRTWVDIDQLVMILREDGYRRVEAERNLLPGDLIVYSNAAGEVQHVGLIVAVDPDLAAGEFSIKILSQWGRDGEYLHSVSDVPDQYGSVVHYYSERQL